MAPWIMWAMIQRIMRIFFKQINAEGAYDLQPVMTLMKFLNESTDEEFAEELGRVS